MEAVLDKAETPFPYYDLKVADRCDRCAAQAFYVAHKKIDGKDMHLLFCGHHAHENLAILGAQGFSIQDEYSRINKRPSSADPDHF